MNESDIAGVVDHVGRLVDEHYTFPEVGGRLRHLLTSQSAAGRYAAANPATLAPLVTEDLQSVNGDKHLRLLYSEEEVVNEVDESAHLAELARQAAATGGGVGRVERLRGNIGYLDLRHMLFPAFVAGDAVVAAMNLVAPAEALIIDLRQFWTLPYAPGPRLGPTKPVYVLTSATTFSGGEEFAYDLQQLRRATIVGERTRGGAHPREGFRVHPHLLATIPVARSVHPVTGTNWEGVGIAPDVEAPADGAYPAAYRMALDHVPKLDGQVAEEAREALAELA